MLLLINILLGLFLLATASLLAMYIYQRGYKQGYEDGYETFQRRFQHLDPVAYLDSYDPDDY